MPPKNLAKADRVFYVKVLQLTMGKLRQISKFCVQSLAGELLVPISNYPAGGGIFN